MRSDTFRPLFVMFFWIKLISSITFGLFVTGALLRNSRDNFLGCGVISFLISICCFIAGYFFYKSSGNPVGFYSSIAYAIIGVLLTTSYICVKIGTALSKAVAFIIIGGLCGYAFFLLVEIIIWIYILLALAIVWFLYSLFNG